MRATGLAFGIGLVLLGACQEPEVGPGLNGCDDDPDRETDGRVTVTSWPDCEGDTRVRLVTVDGGGHTWFSDEFGDGPAGAVDATALVTEFFGLSGQ